MTQHLSRTQLAARLNVSLKTIDRLRDANKISWIDVSGGRGAKPLIRFKIEDVEAFEAQMRQAGPDRGGANEPSD